MEQDAKTQEALKAARQLIENTYMPSKDDDGKHYRVLIEDWDRLANALNAAGVPATEE